MKKLILLFAITTLISSCSKSDSANPDPDGKSNTLFSESTGWKRVAIIGNIPASLGVANWITPLDLNIVDNKAQVILYQNSNFQQQNNFKASYVIGSNAAASVTRLNNLFSFQDNSNNVQFGNIFFKPNTYDVETLNSTGDHYLRLNNEAGTQITTHYVNNLYSGTSKMYPNGDLLIGGLYNSTDPAYYYYTRATNSWALGDGTSFDLTYNIEYLPFKIADGSLLSFRFFNKNNPEKAFFAIADIVQTSTASYQDKFVEEHPEYAPTAYIIHQYTPNETIFASTITIAGYTVENNSFTVVLREENNTTHNYTLSAFKWTKGAVTFQNLYSHLPISKLLGDGLGANSVCKPDGEIGVIVKEGVNGNQMTYSLATCNASGEHKYGSVVNNTYPRAVTLLSCLRYINGSYYAVASPSLFSSDNGDGQHLDIVKLTL